MTMSDKQGSHILSVMAEAEVLIELPEECTQVRPGDSVTVLPLARL